MTSSLKSNLRQYCAYFLVWTMPGLFMFSQGAVQKIVDNVVRIAVRSMEPRPKEAFAED
jgi:hypothetical protein